VERRVVFSPEAAADLFNIYDLLPSNRARSALSAISLASRAIVPDLDFCERGTKRDDIRPGLRITGFERRITIAFHVETTTIVIDRVLYAGRDVKRALRSRRKSAPRSPVK
jgi:toxin ParE1/3/4